MKPFSLLLAALLFLGSVAVAQTGDLGAQIIAADTALGTNQGAIPVTASGTISEGKVSLSAGHDLICSNEVTISLTPGSYLYLNSNTQIKNCIISATSTPIQGEVQSVNTSNVVLDSVTFTGGGYFVYWNGVSDFLITNNKAENITAVAPGGAMLSGYFLVNCSHGKIDNFSASNFVFPASLNSQDFSSTAIGSCSQCSSTGIMVLNLSSYITVNNPTISNVDASYVLGGAGVVVNAGSSHVTVNGGIITANPNMDGVLSQTYSNNVPSSHLTIVGLDSSYNGGVGLNTAAPLGLGDGLDIINTTHVYISHCILDGDGSLHDEQPAIWLFLDDDVLVADSDLSDGSMAGIAAAGSPNVRLVRDTINRNQASGVFTEWQGGTATNVGTAVTFSNGVSGGFGLSWLPGTPFIFDDVTYPIASVTDSTHLILATSPPDHSSPVAWGVNTTQQIVDTVIDDNGLGKFGGQIQVGISWADGTTGTISGVTSTNTGIGVQLYALELANTASVSMDNDNFSGNSNGGNGILGGILSVSLPSLSFPSQGVATSSSTQTVTVIAGAVVVQNFNILASSNFSQTNNCGTTLAAFATCQIQLTFTPTTPGKLTGTVTITASSPNGPQSISLSGVGVAEQTLSPATLSFPIQGIATSSPAQTVTLTAGVAAVQNLAIHVSSGFSQTNNCGTGLRAQATCDIQLTFTPNEAGTFNGTLSVTDSAPDSPQTVALSGIATYQGLGLGTATSGLNSVTVAPGSIAKYSLSIGGAGMSGTASLSCAGAPAGATCTLPSTETVSATQSMPFTVSVATTAPSMSALHPGYLRSSAWLWAFSIAWVVLPAGLSRKRLGRRILPSSLLLVLMFLCSCGGDPKTLAPPGTPAGQYTLTVTAQVGSTSEQTTLILTVK